jgi:hypothetical protein
MKSSPRIELQSNNRTDYLSSILSLQLAIPKFNPGHLQETFSKSGDWICFLRSIHL